jgi:hypothetical protein
VSIAASTKDRLDFENHIFGAASFGCGLSIANRFAIVALKIANEFQFRGTTAWATPW